jgi:MraZ protein
METPDIGAHGSAGTHALLLTGTYEHSIDAKNRLAMPAEIRETLEREGESKVFYIVPLEGVVALFPESVFRQRAEDLERSPLPPERVLDYELVFFSAARRVEIDGQHRIRLPEAVLSDVNIGRDVVLLGVRDHLQIKDRQRWYDERRKTLSDQPELLMNPRRLLRPAPAASES